MSRISVPQQTLKSSQELLLPSGVIGETYPRLSTPSAAIGVATTAKAHGFPIPLRRGKVISHITFETASTAAATVTHIWFGLADSSLNDLGKTNDVSAWAANTALTLDMASPYTIRSDDVYYLVYMVAATTMPGPIGMVTGIRDVTVGGPLLPYPWRDDAHTGLTTPASGPGTYTASTDLGNVFYGYVS